MPSPTNRIAAALLGILASGSALAQELPAFSFAEACRIDGTSAVVRMVYQGGNCETTVDLEPRVELDGTGAMVIIATRSTADMCTMQIVPNYVQKTIGIAPDTAELDITLLSPQLEPQGQETIPVLTDGVDCAAKGEGP
jgi:hypothetical protein